MAFGDLSQFDYLYDALVKKYPDIGQADGASSLFQFMATPMAANWKTPNDNDAYNLANSTSTSLDGFFVPGNSFATSYTDLVTSIESTSGASNPAYRNGIIQIAAIDGARKSLVSQAADAFNLYKANNPGTQVTMVTWLADAFGGQTFSDQLTELQARRSDYVMSQVNVLRALDAPLAAAQKAVTPFAEMMNVSQGGQTQSVPLMTIGGDLPGDVLRWTSSQPGENDFNVVINASSTISSPWKTTTTSEVHRTSCGMSSSVTVDTSRIVADSQFKLVVSAVGVGSYKINRGQWFDESLVSPSTKIVQGSVWTQDSFFGPEGTLHLIPDLVFVMYRPSITLTVSTETFKQQIEAHADEQVDFLNLMGFRFNVAGLASLTPVSDGTTTTVTFAAPASQPAQIVGIMSKVAYNGDKPAAALRSPADLVLA